MLPGKSGEIKVTFNSRKKTGKITKTVTIYSNDESQPIKKIFIYAKVVPQNRTPKGAHDAMNMMRGSYFAGKCANCHIEQGIGKYGKALYDADCVMCHGVEGSGVENLTPPLSNQNFLSSVLDEELYNRIAKGTSNVMMLGFSIENSGPLNKKQLGSLVEYIRSFQEKSIKDSEPN